MADTPNDVANPDRRNFLVLSTMTMAGIGAAAGGVGLIRTMTPTRDVAGGGVIEVSLEGISEGSGIIATAGRKKYSIRRRTAEEIAAAVADDATADAPLSVARTFARRRRIVRERKETESSHAAVASQSLSCLSTNAAAMRRGSAAARVWARR